MHTYRCRDSQMYTSRWLTSVAASDSRMRSSMQMNLKVLVKYVFHFMQSQCLVTKRP